VVGGSVTSLAQKLYTPSPTKRFSVTFSPKPIIPLEAGLVKVWAAL